MGENINFRVTVSFDCYNMVSEKDFHDEFDCNPMAAYRFISDNFRDSVINFSTDEEEVISVELLPQKHRLI